MPADLKIALLYPPVTDPTSGYHSLNYLDSFARSRGWPAADLIDANIEAFHFSLGDVGAAWLDECVATPSEPVATDPMSPALRRARLLKAGRGNVEAARDAVRVLRDPVLFYDYPRYVQAVTDVIAWMNFVGLAGVPGQFDQGFQFIGTPKTVIGSTAPLTDTTLLAQFSRPFQAYYENDLLPRLRAANYDVVGLSIAYMWQLPFALWLARLIRAALPDTVIVAGGTEVSDVWKYATNKQLVFEVFSSVDILVIGEGETAYTSILEAVSAGTVPTAHPNIRLHPRYGPARALPLHYEPLADLPIPDFSNLPWHLYLSPEPFVYYAPTRGCYWNKCTFCDYGLNENSPTSPWRQSTVERMIRDVTSISELSRFIYFSVDVLAPATILRFAERAVEEHLDIRWGAEIRLEKYWSDERCALLRDSGCVAVSVGFESGNQRILDLIDKGTRPAQIKQTISAMTNAGIAVQMMGFTGFPTETADEAMDTIAFLQDNRENWSLAGLGEFVLTSGSIIARQPERFGITNMRPMAGSEIARSLDYDEPISQQAAEVVAKSKAKVNHTRFKRPWVGGIDAPHTYFYHDRHGTRLLTNLRRELLGSGTDGATSPFVINGEFLPMPDEATLVRYGRLYGLQANASPAGSTCFRRTDGAVFLLPSVLRDFITLFARPSSLLSAGMRTLLDDADAERLWALSVEHSLIRQVLAEPAVLTGAGS